MDMLGFLRLRAWEQQEQEKKKPGSASLMKSGRGKPDDAVSINLELMSNWNSS